ncbi:hypothetical protein SKAU_G00223660 [Synaphobranchus kaupii]|uniref:Uncharacterized protein n=1 Tax=Synaphobranchus kaupii TaxID=118154 RepID=A0A9Q1IVR3_SYNKA|nr:hypothetical protein SKAU_G00223660 [Synaphobranchus kaupii]
MEKEGGKASSVGYREECREGEFRRRNLIPGHLPTDHLMRDERRTRETRARARSRRVLAGSALPRRRPSPATVPRNFSFRTGATSAFLPALFRHPASGLSVVAFIFLRACDEGPAKLQRVPAGGPER